MCTLEKRGNIFILTLTGPDKQNRFNPETIESIVTALRQVTTESTPGSVLITTTTSKFFSNGFDLEWARSGTTPVEAFSRLSLMVQQFRTVVAALIALPMPSIAAISGHAAAAGFALAICHDYVLMRSDRGVLYMSEVDIGLPLPDYFAALFRAKLGSVATRRDVLLKGKRVKGEEAVKIGIVDSAHDSEAALVEATMRLAEQLGKRGWKGGVYEEIRKSLYPDLCGVLRLEMEKQVVSRL